MPGSVSHPPLHTAMLSTLWSSDDDEVDEEDDDDEEEEDGTDTSSGGGGGGGGGSLCAIVNDLSPSKPLSLSISLFIDDDEHSLLLLWR